MSPREAMTAVQTWFVYYKVPREAEGDVIAQARRTMSALPVASRLMKKLGESDYVTLMEVYEGIDNAATFHTALANALAASGMARELVDTRHIEVFAAAD